MPTIFRFVFEAEDEKFSHDYFDKQSVEAFSRPHIHTATGKTVFELVNWKGTTSNNPTIQSACDNISYVRFWRRTICHTFQQIMSRMNGMFRPIATKYGNGPADECSQRTLSLSWWSNSIKGLYYSRIDSLYVSRSRVFSCHFTRAFLAYHRIQLDSYDNHKNVQISSFPALLLLRTQIILHTHTSAAKWKGVNTKPNNDDEKIKQSTQKMTWIHRDCMPLCAINHRQTTLYYVHNEEGAWISYTYMQPRLVKNKCVTSIES